MKSLKVYLPLLAISLIALSLTPRDKKPKNCKYIRNEVDEFSKNRVAITDGKVLYSKLTITSSSAVLILTSSNASYRIALSVQGVYVEGIKKLLFNFQALNPPYGGVWSFKHIDLLLENEEVIELADQDLSSFNVYDEWETYSKVYEISDSIWSKLKSIPLKKVRIYNESNNTHSTLEISKKYKSSIQEAVDCINNLKID